MTIHEALAAAGPGGAIRRPRVGGGDCWRWVRDAGGHWEEAVGPRESMPVAWSHGALVRADLGSEWEAVPLGPHQANREALRRIVYETAISGPTYNFSDRVLEAVAVQWPELFADEEETP